MIKRAFCINNNKIIKCNCLVFVVFSTYQPVEMFRNKCTCFSDTLDPYNFVCDDVAFNYRVTGEIVDCARQDRILHYGPCVYRGNVYAEVN